MMADGHRVYEGTLKDFIRIAATDAKNGLLLGLSGLASPLGSPRTKGRETPAEQHARKELHYQRQLLAAFAAAAPASLQQPERPASQAQLPQQSAPQLGNEAGQGEDCHVQPFSPGSHMLLAMEPPLGEALAQGLSDGGEKTAESAGAVASTPLESGQQILMVAPHQGGGSSSSAGGAGHHFSSLLAGSSFLSGLREKVAGAGTKAKALGILPAPGYKPQTTGIAGGALAGDFHSTA